MGATALGLAAFLCLFLLSDGPTLLRILREIRPETLAAPLACTILSYAAMAKSYQEIARTAGLHVSFPEMARITLVSTAANYVISTGGLSGLAVRSLYFSQRHGTGWGNAVSISLAQTFVTNLVLLAFVAWGLVNLVWVDEPALRSAPVALALFALSLLLCALAVVLVASRRVRERLFAFLLAVADFVSRPFVRHRAALTRRLALFEEELHEGVDFLIVRRRQMAGPIVYIVLDWLFMLATLYTAFRCIGAEVPMHVVVIGFSTGVFLSVVNLVPAGLGIMEGSMAAVFAALGVSLETAVVATVIFRVLYYFLPLLLTALLFPEMLRQASRLGWSTAASPPRAGN